MEPLTNWSNNATCVCECAQDGNTVLLSGVGMAAAVWKKEDCSHYIITHHISEANGNGTSSREGGMKCGFGSTHLTTALRKKTALLFVNLASALAGKGHFSTQPLKCYAHR